MAIITNKNNLKPYAHFFYPCSWCYVPPACAHLNPKVGGFILVNDGSVTGEIISIWSCSVGGM